MNSASGGERGGAGAGGGGEVPRGGYVGGGMGLGGLEKRLAKVTISALRGAPDRAQKRVCEFF
jgi:hypothetical protein